MCEQPDFADHCKKVNSPLTPRQTQCLYWASYGKTSLEIGQILMISESTVNYHIREAYSKLDTNRRQAALVKALGAGYLPRHQEEQSPGSSLPKT
ncbi:MAG TPA: LuxR family transcriptional regulator [Pusillimonas sp.]|jgi:DNA-binding CsgD family transcriptional regulator|nr:helix-turn-helix transcriptional regulator [Pusillimonas sp.]MBC41667.1 helix-turn-helix transcriptional regulator [Pusillimonas sp.]HBT33305.1 LuxR family transcriptional regulator [Pusillimonas sp.]HCN70895.1 LuxR family transcriptional regulator [Pusillimonas sp.]HCP79587.1 LuxR family transcriptional regulator [Pusillimonas sp.]|tara:strand:+ start:284 stop:568 length:285 start_codon:yes stop_codon:yes gene_type:complete